MQLNGKQRLANLNAAFTIGSSNVDIKNKNILLIDDIITTGATIHECSKVLKKHGAKSVHVLVIARVEGKLKI
ncbi:ComF family C-terminal domain protein [Candidatus Hepatincolaceae symbiont of Richtersius coronifer]